MTLLWLDSSLFTFIHNVVFTLMRVIEHTLTFTWTLWNPIVLHHVLWHGFTISQVMRMDSFFQSLSELYYMGSFTLFHPHFLVLGCSFPEVCFHRVSLEELLPCSSLFWATEDQALFVSSGMLSVSMSTLVVEILVTLPMSWLLPSEDKTYFSLMFSTCWSSVEVSFVIIFPHSHYSARTVLDYNM